MLSARPTRLLHRLAHAPRRAPTFGVGVRHYNPDQKGDPFDQSHQAGHAARDKRKSGPLDAANPEAGKQADRSGLTGNPEGVGFADQVGSQSATGSESSTQSANAEGANGQENITPPAFLDAVKSKLGFKTTAGEDKQNRGGGKGVTGTGQVTVDHGKRTIHTSAASRKDA